MSAWSWEHAARSLPLLLDGFKITLLATVLGTLIAVVLGLIVAIARRGLPPLFGYPLTGLVEFIRMRSEEHTSELQSRGHLVCRLLLGKKKNSRRDQLHLLAGVCR